MENKGTAITIGKIEYALIYWNFTWCELFSHSIHQSQQQQQQQQQQYQYQYHQYQQSQPHIIIKDKDLDSDSREQERKREREKEIAEHAMGLINTGKLSGSATGLHSFPIGLEEYHAIVRDGIIFLIVVKNISVSRVYQLLGIISEEFISNVKKKNISPFDNSLVREFKQFMIEKMKEIEKLDESDKASSLSDDRIQQLVQNVEEVTRLVKHNVDVTTRISSQQRSKLKQEEEAIEGRMVEGNSSGSGSGSVLKKSVVITLLILFLAISLAVAVSLAVYFTQK